VLYCLAGQENAWSKLWIAGKIPGTKITQYTTRCHSYISVPSYARLAANCSKCLNANWIYFGWKNHQSNYKSMSDCAISMKFFSERVVTSWQMSIRWLGFSCNRLRFQETVPDRCPPTYNGGPTSGNTQVYNFFCLWMGKQLFVYMINGRETLCWPSPRVFLFFFLGWRQFNLITGLSGWWGPN